MIAISVPKDIPNNYKKSSSMSIFIRDKLCKIYQLNITEVYHGQRSKFLSMHQLRIVLVCDATFYGKRKDKLGTLVFKDADSKEILIWKHI